MYQVETSQAGKKHIYITFPTVVRWHFPAVRWAGSGLVRMDMRLVFREDSPGTKELYGGWGTRSPTPVQTLCQPDSREL
jgi:hypothetical protein